MRRESKCNLTNEVVEELGNDKKKFQHEKQMAK